MASRWAAELPATPKRRGSPRCVAHRLNRTLARPSPRVYLVDSRMVDFELRSAYATGVTPGFGIGDKSVSQRCRSPQFSIPGTFSHCQNCPAKSNVSFHGLNEYQTTIIHSMNRSPLSRQCKCHPCIPHRAIQASTERRHIFGLRSDVRENVHFINDSTIAFAAGHQVVLHSLETRAQQFLPGMFGF